MFVSNSSANEIGNSHLLVRQSAKLPHLLGAITCPAPLFYRQTFEVLGPSCAFSMFENAFAVFQLYSKTRAGTNKLRNSKVCLGQELTFTPASRPLCI